MPPKECPEPPFRFRLLAVYTQSMVFSFPMSVEFKQQIKMAGASESDQGRSGHVEGLPAR